METIENDHEAQEERRKWREQLALAASEHERNCPEDVRRKARAIVDLLFPKV